MGYEGQVTNHGQEDNGLSISEGPFYFMKVYLIRHAHAEPAGEGSDGARALTERGRREAEETGRALRERGETIRVVLSSPLLRARETAERIASAFDPAPAIETQAALACGATPQLILETVRARPAGEIALVGHMPDLGIFVGAVAGESMSFRPSSICCVELEADSARVLWVRHPE